MNEQSSIIRYIVISPESNVEFGPYRDRIRADAQAVTQNYDCPTIGPWRVVALAEFVSNPPATDTGD